jgi:hypothetical protein
MLAWIDSMVGLRNGEETSAMPQDLMRAITLICNRALALISMIQCELSDDDYPNTKTTLFILTINQ